jgi:NTE family protein
MEAIFKSQDFKEWSNGIVPEKYKYYYKKFQENPSLYNLDFFRNLENLKFLLPFKVISPGQMDLALVQLFSPASAACHNDFDRLFIPFRCVATDLYNNRPVVLSKGDLSTSIRASMSIPMYFKPVEMDSMLLYDGGLLNNFPVDVMVKEFHPDLIIGSTVAFRNKNSNGNLFRQIENIITRKTSYNVPDSLGFTIQSPVSKIGLFDFDRADSIVNIGYETTLKMMDQIKSRINSASDKRVLQRERESYRRQFPPFLIDKVEISGVDSRMKKYINQSLFRNERILSFDDLKNHYYSLLSENNLKSIQPAARYNEDSRLYQLNLKTEPQRPLSLSVGGYFSLSDVNEGFLGIRYRIFAANPVTLQSSIQFGRFYTSFLFGPRIEFNHKKLFSMDLLIQKSMKNYFTGSSELFMGNKNCYITEDQSKVGFSLNFPEKTTAKWELGLYYSDQEYRYFQSNNFMKTDIPDETNFSFGNVFMKYETGNLNKKQYPTEGKYLIFKTTFTYGTESDIPGSTTPFLLPSERDHSYITVNLNYEKYFPVFRNSTHFLKDMRVGLLTDSWYSNRDFFGNYTAHLISANPFNPTVNSTIRYLPFLRSDNFTAGGLKMIVPLGRPKSSLSAHFRLEGYYFQPLRQIAFFDNNQPYNKKGVFPRGNFFGCGGFVMHTFFGPAALLLNVYDQGDPKFFLQASFGYLLNRN